MVQFTTAQLVVLHLAAQMAAAHPLGLVDGRHRVGVFVHALPPRPRHPSQASPRPRHPHAAALLSLPAGRGLPCS